MKRWGILVWLFAACAGESAPTPSGAPVACNEVDIHGRDWVEFVNPGTVAVDLSGWGLTDELDDADKRWLLPAGSVVPPGGFLVVKGEQTDGDGTGFGFGLKAGDTLYLVDAGGELRLADDIGDPPDGRTWGRYPDGSGPWQPTVPTQGFGNGVSEDLAAPLFDDTRVVTIDLELDAAARAALDANPETFAAATFRLTTPEREYAAVAAAVRLKGGALVTSVAEKPPFKIDFNRADGSARFLGLKGLTLNNLAADPSALHEALGYRLAAAAGLPALRTGFADVRVNGERRGLYAVLQVYDDVMLAAHFATTQHLYEGHSELDPGEIARFDVHEGDAADTADLAALLAAVAAEGGDAWYAGLEPVLDRGAALRFLALEAALGHTDGYAFDANRYYLVSDAAGRFTLLLAQLDRAFAEDLDATAGTSLLPTRCLLSPACTADFEAAVAAVRAVFQSRDWGAEAARLDALVRPYCEREPKVPCALPDHDAAVANVRARLTAAAE